MPGPIPTVGTVEQGYRFKGGNPKDRASWEPVSDSLRPLTAGPGARYLPSRVAPRDKSEDAYFRQWRQTDDPSVGQARAALGDDRRMEALLGRQKTGGVYSIPVLGGIVGAFDPEIREMDALQAKVARQNRTPGEGAISDFDANQFLKMSYGKDKPTETNQALIRARRMANDATIQRRQFGEWYKGRYNSLNGMPEAWDRYAQDNPIFSGEGMLNSKRMEWRSYFGAGGDARPGAASQDATRAAKNDQLKAKSAKTRGFLVEKASD